MSSRHGGRTGLLVELAVSLASALILAAGAKVLGMLGPSLLERAVPVWLLVSVTPSVALATFFVARSLRRPSDQAFILIATFTWTQFLADLIRNLVWALERHGVDLVVKLPHHDYTGRSQVLQLASIRRGRHSYIGGMIIPDRPERIRSEIMAFCSGARLPVVFLDRPPFVEAETYAPHTAFVGCSAEEIGERAARWVARELTERARERPHVLVVGGDGQTGRHLRFEKELREALPLAKIEVNTGGFFSREHAKDIVGRHLRHLARGDERLDAIFCTNDEMALGALDAVQERQIAPDSQDDVIIVGVDGTPQAIWTIKSGATPFQATVVQDIRQIAETAVDALLRMRAGERVPTVSFVSTSIYPT